MASHAKIIQNTKLLYVCNYLKKEVSDEVSFLHADNHQSFLQVGTMILMWMNKHSESLQNSKFTMSLHLKKEVKDEVDFSHANKHQTFKRISR